MTKKILVNLTKVAVSAGIIIYLCIRASRDQSFSRFIDEPKDWPILCLAFLAALLGVMVTFVRWRMLVRMLGLPFSYRDAFRLGFLGFLLNFFTFGVVGGDVLKAIFLIHGHPNDKLKAVSSIVVDRVVGLYALMFLSAATFLCIPLPSENLTNPTLHAVLIRIGWSVVMMAGVLTLLLVIGMLIGKTRLVRWRWLRTGRIGLLEQTLTLYRSGWPRLLLAGCMGLCNHSLFVGSIYLVAIGLPGAVPTFLEHLVIVPMSLMTNSIPLPGGIGAFEVALNVLYQGVATAEILPSQGFLVALGYRLITIVIAAVGLAFYLSSRREVKQLLEEAKHEPDLAI